MKDKAAFDTNILVYALGGDHDEHGSEARRQLARDGNRKAEISQSILAAPGTISIQAFNEFANTGRKKLGLQVGEIHEILNALQRVHEVVAINWDTTRLALSLAAKSAFSFYDALIVAAALLAGCKLLYSEDMQHGRVVLGELRIVNPFL